MQDIQSNIIPNFNLDENATSFEQEKIILDIDEAIYQKYEVGYPEYIDHMLYYEIKQVLSF